MDIVQSGAVHAIDLRAKQEELRETDQSYIQVSSLPRSLKSPCGLQPEVDLVLLQ